MFTIADAADRAVGHIGLSRIPGAGARASIGYWIVASHRRRGYAAEALTTLTACAAGLDESDRRELYVEPWNEVPGERQRRPASSGRG